MKSLEKIFEGIKQIIFIDFEATSTGEMIAIGATKARIRKEGRIGPLEEFGFKEYVRPDKPVGKVVEKLTGISDDFLLHNGKLFEYVFKKFILYCGKDFFNSKFIVFGNYDQVIFTNAYNKTNKTQDRAATNFCENLIDFQILVSNLVSKKVATGFSLSTLLEVYNLKPHGEAHDPLNDAFDLANIYRSYTTDDVSNRRIYLEYLNSKCPLPAPVNAIVHDILNGKQVCLKDLKKEIDKILK